MCVQRFQKTGETDGFLLNTLGISDGRLLYTSKYLLGSLLFIVLLEWVHPTTYGHYLYPSSFADVNCNVVVKERSRLNCGCTRLFDQLYLLHTTIWTQKRDISLIHWALRTYFSMININTVLNSCCLGCSWSYKLHCRQLRNFFQIGKFFLWNMKSGWWTHMSCASTSFLFSLHQIKWLIPVHN